MVSLGPREQSASFAEPETSARRSPDVVLIGYQDQGNLGMGYLAAVLQKHGRIVEMIDIRDGPECIATHLVSRQPLLVGF